MRRRPGSAAARPTVLALLAILAALPAGTTGNPAGGTFSGRAQFADRRNPPPRRELDVAAREAFELGLLVFNTPWVVAGSPNAGRIDGLGPLFVSNSCDACHNNGARGRPAAGPGGLSNSFVMQLDGQAAQPYGAVLGTAAIPDHSREGVVQVDWSERSGQYADGTRWKLREPRYRLGRLLYGPPPPATVLRPRIAPAVFGTGLLESVTTATLRDIRRRQPRALRGALPQGRFGWQAEAKDIADQTARAFAREMGLTSELRGSDDCTPAQVACRNAPHGGAPEVSDEFMRAVLAYQRELAVPARRALAPEREEAGRRLFADTGCATCHVERLPAGIDDGTGYIDAFTDLLLHDMGDGLADRRADGRVVKSRWRTAPLWGMTHALQFEDVALLHDGRAASLEEAILWHGGQAEGARRAFIALPAAERALLIEWVESL